MNKSTLKEVKVHLLDLSQGFSRYQKEISAHAKLQKAKTQSFLKNMKRAKREVEKATKVKHIAMKEIYNALDVHITDLNYHLVYFRAQLLPLLELQESLKSVHEEMEKELNEELAELQVC